MAIVFPAVTVKIAYPSDTGNHQVNNYELNYSGFY